MTNVLVEIETDIFNDVYIKHLDNYARTQIFFGGAGSGKSVFVAQRAVIDVLQGGRNYLVCRQVARTINRSVFGEIVKAINKLKVRSLFAVNKSDFSITCENGYQILFAGLDDPEKIKSIIPQKGVITDIVVDEATETSRGTVKQLTKRQRGGSEETPKRITLLFNPVMQTHWIYEDYFAGIVWADDQTEYFSDDLSIQKTWFIHNKFLTQSDIDDLVNEPDEYYRDVYAFGNWGVLGNVIFTNWEVRDLSGQRAQMTNHRNGLDFGFANDPAALAATHYDKPRKTIYIYDELYERGLTNDVLATGVKGVIGYQDVTCDSAEPKSITELRQYGVKARGARKGKDSVLHGIQWLQQQHIIIDAACINAKNEFMAYKWREDKDGNVIRQPVDERNHIIDALRYAYEDEMTFAKAGSTKYT